MCQAGSVTPEQLVDMSRQLRDLGATRVSYGDFVVEFSQRAEPTKREPRPERPVKAVTLEGDLASAVAG